MVTEQQVRKNLEEILVPGAMRSLVKLNLVHEITISDRKVDITLASTALNKSAQDWLKSTINDASTQLTGINHVIISNKQYQGQYIAD